MESFQTNPISLSYLLGSIHQRRLALPDFQRDFVWMPRATEQLIESIGRSFPAGSLLFYPFQPNTFKPRSVENAPDLDGNPLELVLDGQQRLTSLYQAFYRVGDHRYFMDLRCLMEDADIEEAVFFRHRNKSGKYSSIEAQAEQLVLPLGEIFGGDGFHEWRDAVLSGKTFFARWLAERAKGLGFATAEVQISEGETPLHRLETVYRRPLQEQAIEPILVGRHALLGAPTAGGKTEAALLPLLSRMVGEQWSGLSVLYVCPLRALLNNLLPRVQSYARLLGREAALWHGDVAPSERKAIVRDPPEVLLTTPESIEAILMSRSVDAERLFSAVRAVVVDEIHAFAGDDRGWHLLALLARLGELTGRELQRIGLTATVGNPGWLVEWLACGAEGEREVVMTSPPGEQEIDVSVDWVASVPNAAKVVASLHRGDKRLVFADSRTRVEELASALRSEGATVFVSHSSLSRDDRRAAERAFAETRDCVIVATSTLELGIDVGDLDRVIQVGAPRTVASLLQRMGRTGRRAGTTRNCLFLATGEMELLQALALVRLLRQGWVEPLVAPAQPRNLVAQQMLARVLAAGRLGRSSWPGSFDRVGELAGLSPDLYEVVLACMLDRGVLIEDSGVISMGPAGEDEYGRRNFMEVTSLFLTEPLLAARWGQRDLGAIDPSSLASRDGRRPTILLGGRALGDVDWERRIAWVEPTEDPGRSRWAGAGAALSIEVCHAMRSVLADPTMVTDCLTRRASGKLEEVREERWWVAEGATTLVEDDSRERRRWWTFAGARANRSLARALDDAGTGTSSCDDLSIGLTTRTSASRLLEVTASIDTDALTTDVDRRRVDAVKFGACLPDDELVEMLAARDLDPIGVSRPISEPISSALLAT